jgi:methionyl-tRNA formyltransferase
MKILFCAYRDWANQIYNQLVVKFGTEHDFWIASSAKELEISCKIRDYDVIILVGWSWKVPADIVNAYLIIGMHPSDLPQFAGGSPIQNQILSGVKQTRATLFKLNETFDAGEIIDKEPINLEGHLDQVLNSISIATLNLIKRFITNFPNFTLTSQANCGEASHYPRCKPEHSKLTLPSNTTCTELWNFIRCREDPYPNAYFEDDTGVLVIKQVEFIKK